MGWSRLSRSLSATARRDGTTSWSNADPAGAECSVVAPGAPYGVCTPSSAHPPTGPPQSSPAPLHWHAPLRGPETQAARYGGGARRRRCQQAGGAAGPSACRRLQPASRKRRAVGLINRVVDGPQAPAQLGAVGEGTGRRDPSLGLRWEARRMPHRLSTQLRGPRRRGTSTGGALVMSLAFGAGSTGGKGLFGAALTGTGRALVAAGITVDGSALWAGPSFSSSMGWRLRRASTSSTRSSGIGSGRPPPRERPGWARGGASGGPDDSGGPHSKFTSATTSGCPGGSGSPGPPAAPPPSPPGRR